MSALTREQVEQLCERIRKEITWKHEIGYILETDAALRQEAKDQKDKQIALRQQLAQVNHILTCGHPAKWYAVDDDANNDCLGCRTTSLQEQLAQVKIANQEEIIAYLQQQLAERDAELARGKGVL